VSEASFTGSFLDYQHQLNTFGLRIPEQNPGLRCETEQPGGRSVFPARSLAAYFITGVGLSCH